MNMIGVSMNGLFLVTLPIGNEGDITKRAVDVLSQVNMIYAEDTRVFKTLAMKIGIDLADKKVISYHEHSSDGQVDHIISLAKNEAIAFVSDAGSPIISDPAFPLVKKALLEDVKIHSISGISAVIVALELSGLPSTPFHFHGFLPRDKSRLQGEIELIKNQYGTHIYFEGKSRVLNTLKMFSEQLPGMDFVLCRELTKEFESIYRFKGESYSQIKDEIYLKGEFVILVNNSNKNDRIECGGELKDLALEIIEKGAKPKKLAKLLSLITGTGSKEIYEVLNKFGRQ